MYCVRDAARLRARAMNMLKAESANLIEGFGFGDGVSCHDNHAFLPQMLLAEIDPDT
jgi:hypothetical protein